MTGTSLRLLLVSYKFAPSDEAGANRATALARHLREVGHEVTVLTSSAHGALSEDSTAGNVRTTDLRVIASRLRRTPPATEDPGDAAAVKVNPLSRVLVPDAHLLAWTPFGLARALRLTRTEAYDCVLTTSPPESVHLIGMALRRLRAIPWVADLRDGWALEPWIKEDLWPTRMQHRLNEWLERHVLREADAVTAVSPAVADYLRDELNLRSETVANGWEPAADSSPVAKEALGLDPGRVSVVYTGGIANARRDATPLIDALAALAQEDPRTAERLELVFCGSFTDAERELFGTDCSPARIVNLGRLDRVRVVALQRAADAGIDLTPPAGRQATSSKLYEYIGAGLPIVALSPPNGAVAAIVADANGIVVRLDDRPGIVAALRAIAAGDVEAPGDAARAAYSWPSIAERMAGVMRSAIRGA
jgi:glycosyltransferase involved in cell wall biosynthesis